MQYNTLTLESPNFTTNHAPIPSCPINLEPYPTRSYGHSQERTYLEPCRAHEFRSRQSGIAHCARYCVRCGICLLSSCRRHPGALFADVAPVVVYWTLDCAVWNWYGVHVSRLEVAHWVIIAGPVILVGIVLGHRVTDKYGESPADDSNHKVFSLSPRIGFKLTEHDTRPWATSFLGFMLFSVPSALLSTFSSPRIARDARRRITSMPCLGSLSSFWAYIRSARDTTTSGLYTPARAGCRRA